MKIRNIQSEVFDLTGFNKINSFITSDLGKVEVYEEIKTAAIYTLNLIEGEIIRKDKEGILYGGIVFEKDNSLSSSSIQSMPRCTEL